LEGDSADVSVEEGVCAPAVELDLSAEELFAVILRPLFFRTILSHLENYSSPAKLHYPLLCGSHRVSSLLDHQRQKQIFVSFENW